MLRSKASPGRVDDTHGCRTRGSWGWCPDDQDGRQRDPAALRRAGQAGAGLGRNDERRPVAARGRRPGDRADALLRGHEPVGERGVAHRQRGDPDVRRGRRPGVFDSPGLPVGGLALAEGTPAGGRLPHHPQDPRLHPRPAGTVRGGEHPPANLPRGGPARWTHDSAKRIVGWTVDTPESVQEKVAAIHDLAADDQVAARVATDYLRRPAVASKAMADDAARHAVNEAQFDQFRQQVQYGQEEAAPQLDQLRRMEHNTQFMDLVAVCTPFTVTAGRIVPTCGVSPTTTPNARRSCGALRGCGRRRTGSRTRSPAARSTWTSSFRSC